jgi:hypothetical protein
MIKKLTYFLPPSPYPCLDFLWPCTGLCVHYRLVSSQWARLFHRGDHSLGMRPSFHKSLSPARGTEAIDPDGLPRASEVAAPTERHPASIETRAEIDAGRPIPGRRDPGPRRDPSTASTPRGSESSFERLDCAWSAISTSERSRSRGPGALGGSERTWAPRLRPDASPFRSGARSILVSF